MPGEGRASRYLLREYCVETPAGTFPCFNSLSGGRATDPGMPPPSVGTSPATAYLFRLDRGTQLAYAPKQNTSNSMSALNPPRHVSRKHELREDTVITLYARVWEFFDQNRKVVYGALAGLAAVVLIVVGYVFYLGRQQDRAAELLGGVVQLYEEGQLRDALDGTAGSPGLLEIADEYGRTDAGNLARFYAADALFRLGEYDDALEHFRRFSKEKNLIGASAIAGEAAVNETRGEFRRAGDLYRRAALYFENELRSPEYLLQAARAYEQAGAYDQAEEVIDLAADRFPDSSVADAADFHKARLAAKKSS